MVASLPPALSLRLGVVPLGVEAGVFVVGAAGALSESVLDELSFAVGHRVVVRDLAAEELAASLATVAEAVRGGAVTERSPVSVGLTGTVVHQIDQLLEAAVGAGASDVHVEPYEGALRVRFRVDGVLREVARPDPSLQAAYVSRLKVMAGLDIAERRRPQDGRIPFVGPRGAVDLRVSTLPTHAGEKVVLRVLDRGGVVRSLDSLDLTEGDRATVQRALRRPNGMVLVTGPTGSGKTTTLYAALLALNTAERNVLTVEDPVEYYVEGVNQSQVRGEIGYTFAHALRTLLRQDPDVIMVGEIRDQETAEIAVRSALTGHLVLSTLHTNDAPATVTRLVDMGVEPYLVASALRVVAAQRLVRRVCKACAVRVPAGSDAREVGITSSEVIVGAGCDACGGTGYRGRRALFEMMEVDEAVEALISAGARTDALRRHAVGAGMRTLREAGVALISEGETTPAEVLRETS